MHTEDEGKLDSRGKVIRLFQQACGESPCFGEPAGEKCMVGEGAVCIWLHDCHRSAKPAE